MHEARALGLEVIDRCNLTVLQEPGQEDLPHFLAAHQARPPGCTLHKHISWMRMPPSSPWQPCILVGARQGASTAHVAVQVCVVASLPCYMLGSMSLEP